MGFKFKKTKSYKKEQKQNKRKQKNNKPHTVEEYRKMGVKKCSQPTKGFSKPRKTRPRPIKVGKHN